jgi:hypothetical protein
MVMAREHDPLVAGWLLRQIGHLYGRHVGLLSTAD